MSGQQATALKAGLLFKRSEVVKQWNERWAAVFPGELLYWKTKDDCVKGKPARGRIALSSESVVISRGSDTMIARFMFELQGDTITSHFAGW